MDSQNLCFSKKLLFALQSHDPFAEIVKAAEEQFSFPLSLMRRDWEIVAASSLEIFRRYGVDPLKKLMPSDIQNIERSKKDFVSFSFNTDGITRTVLKVRRRNMVVGYIILVCGYQSMENALSRSDLFALASSYSAALSMGKDTVVDEKNSTWDKLLLDLITRKIGSDSLLQNRLDTISGLYRPERMFIFQIESRGNTISSAAFSELYNLLAEKADYVAATISGTGAAVLCDVATGIPAMIKDGSMNRFLLEHRLYSGYAGPFFNVADTAEFYDLAICAAEYVKRWNISGVIQDYNDCRLFNLIMNVQTMNKDLRQYVSDGLFDMRKYDEANNTKYYETVRALIEHNYNFRETAEELYIHKTTLTYRLRRACDLFGLDFDDWHKRLQLQISIYIIESFSL